MGRDQGADVDELIERYKDVVDILSAIFGVSRIDGISTPISIISCIIFVHDYVLHKQLDVGRWGNNDADGLMMDEYDDLAHLDAIYTTERSIANSFAISKRACLLSKIFE